MWKVSDIACQNATFQTRQEKETRIKKVSEDDPGPE